MNLSKLSMQVKICCAIGDDSESKTVLDYLKRFAIDVSTVTTIRGCSTGRAVILIGSEGEVTTMAQRGANIHLDPTAALEGDHDLLYVTSIPLNAVSRLKKYLAAEATVQKKVVFNPGLAQIEACSGDVADLMRRADLVIMNSAEATAMTRALGRDRIQSTELVELARKLLSYGLRAVVITNGPDGALFASPEYHYFQPALPSRVRSTLGAGDAFGATLAYYFFSKCPLQKAIHLAAINAAAATNEIDANSGALTRVEVERRLADSGFARRERLQ